MEERKSVHVRSGDTVKVLSGKDKGKQGKVIIVSPKEGKVIIEGLNIGKKHVKPRKMGKPGGIISVERPMYSCKVQLVCPKCGKATRIGHKILSDGTKQRQCKKAGCGEAF
ncbi:MAG: 50S ribosomal protein L24 [Oscillospiraceae bacterium]|nr:50S ribosomal protein L24 [Oscillospiraceae bacterium]